MFFHNCFQPHQCICRISPLSRSKLVWMPPSSPAFIRNRFFPVLPNSFDIWCTQPTKRVQNLVCHSERYFFRRWLHGLAGRISLYKFFGTNDPPIGSLGADGEDFSFMYDSYMQVGLTCISVNRF
jgi:hypothetical protein